MEQQYLIRLDDACPTMNVEKWERIEKVLDMYDIKPMVGVIPCNEDPQLILCVEDFSFWDKVNLWDMKGWTIAMHGYNHCYISDKGMDGINPMWKFSEFAGVPFEIQCKKIRDGYLIMQRHGIEPKFFFAPGHTFDENTLNALRKESKIRIISDSIATNPYHYKDFVFIPQFSGRCRNMKVPGTFTFCFHPNTMSDDSFERLESFVKKNKKKFISFNEIDLKKYDQKKNLDKILSRIFFLYRHFRR